MMPVEAVERTEAQTEEEQQDELAIALLALLLSLSASDVRQLPALPAYLRYQLVDRVEDTFLRNADDIIAQLMSGRIDISQWQRLAEQLIRTHQRTLQMSAVGGVQLGPGHRQKLRRLYRTERAYLQRFADALREQTRNNQALSEDYIRHRLRLYMGNPRGEFFRTVEGELPQGSVPGWVIRYRAIDDVLTCQPCSNADGMYLPGEGPMPGEICKGKSYCRCRREWYWRPDIYARLTAGKDAGEKAGSAIRLR